MKTFLPSTVLVCLAILLNSCGYLSPSRTHIKDNMDLLEKALNYKEYEKFNNEITFVNRDAYYTNFFGLVNPWELLPEELDEEAEKTRSKKDPYLGRVGYAGSEYNQLYWDQNKKLTSKQVTVIEKRNDAYYPVIHNTIERPAEEQIAIKEINRKKSLLRPHTYLHAICRGISGLKKVAFYDSEYHKIDSDLFLCITNLQASSKRHLSQINNFQKMSFLFEYSSDDDEWQILRIAERNIMSRKTD